MKFGDPVNFVQCFHIVAQKCCQSALSKLSTVEKCFNFQLSWVFVSIKTKHKALRLMAIVMKRHAVWHQRSRSSFRFRSIFVPKISLLAVRELITHRISCKINIDAWVHSTERKNRALSDRPSVRPFVGSLVRSNSIQFKREREREIQQDNSARQTTSNEPNPSGFH